MADLDPIYVTQQLTEHHEEIGSLKHRMTTAEEVIKEIHDISTSVKLLAQESKNTGQKVDTLTAKVSEIEKKPGQKAEKLKDTVISDIVKLLVAAIVGGLIALVVK